MALLSGTLPAHRLVMRTGKQSDDLERVMGTADGFLSQEEIDSLYKQATGKEVARTPSAAPVAKEAIAKPPAVSTPKTASPSVPLQKVAGMAPDPSLTPRAVSSANPAQTLPEGVLKQLQTAMADLTQRLAKAEAGIRRMEEDNRQETPGAALPAQQLSQSMTVMERELQRLSRQVDGILSGLDNTPDYDVRSSFTCVSCGSSGTIAIPMRCAACGREGWWGWWTKER